MAKLRATLVFAPEIWVSMGFLQECPTQPIQEMFLLSVEFPGEPTRDQRLSWQDTQPPRSR